MKKSAKPKQNRIALLTLLFTLMVFMIFASTMLIMGLAGYILIRSGIWTIEGNAKSDLLFILLIFALASIGVGTFLALTLGRLPFRPVNRLIRGLRRLAEGDYEARLPEGKHYLGKELSGSFNRLAEELQNTEILRSDFVNSFSHEFKTPIVSIRGFAQLLNRGGLSEEQTREYLGIIQEESGRLAEMATGVLNYTRIENQKILTGTAPFNLSEQIRTCILLLEKKWSRKHLRLSLEFQEHTVTANEEMLKQFWINLLDNAVNSPRKGAPLRFPFRKLRNRSGSGSKTAALKSLPGIRTVSFRNFIRGTAPMPEREPVWALPLPDALRNSTGAASPWRAMTCILPLR